METYSAMKARHREEFNTLPIKWAFSNKQFAEGMKELGLDESNPDDMKKVCSVPAGGFILKTDSEKLDDMFTRHEKEIQEAIKSDTNGFGFAYDMFNYELSNHEYCVTGDLMDTLNALGMSIDEVNASNILIEALQNAINNQSTSW